MQTLDEKTALLTFDFAQKMQPMYVRERQKDYYGKAGMSCHISHALTMKNGEAAQHLSVHILGHNVKQVVLYLLKSLFEVILELSGNSCSCRSYTF